MIAVVRRPADSSQSGTESVARKTPRREDVYRGPCIEYSGDAGGVDQKDVVQGLVQIFAAQAADCGVRPRLCCGRKLKFHTFAPASIRTGHGSFSLWFAHQDASSANSLA